MQIELKQLQRKLGITFIYVTHDQDEALSMSDRIVVIRNGNIEQIGTPEDVYEKPNSLYVADFLGEANVFKGYVSKIDKDNINLLHFEIIYKNETIDPETVYSLNVSSLQ